MSQIKLLDKIIFNLGTKHLYPCKVIIDDQHVFSINRKLYELKSNCYLMGWFQNEKYFCDIRKELIRDFTPKNKIKITKDLKEILDKENCISIHLRRGDYVKINRFIGIEYYKKAIDHICNIIKEPVFLVFSDDINWVKKNLSLTHKIYFISDFGDYEDYEEMLIMSRCNHNIIANSTFSWWAAWLNKNPNKIVIAPKKWGWGKNDEEIIPQKWIRL